MCVCVCVCVCVLLQVSFYNSPQAASGFMLIICCSNGRILFASDTLQDVLGDTPVSCKLMPCYLIVTTYFSFVSVVMHTVYVYSSIVYTMPCICTTV